MLASIAIATVLALAAQTGSAQQPEPKTQQAPEQTLQQGTPVERAIAGGESHHYLLPLTAGQFVRVAINQRGIDLMATATTPEGRKLAELEGHTGSNGIDRVLIFAETSGNYRLQIRPVIARGTAGRYEVSIVDLRPATQEDKNRVSAQTAFSDGVLASRETTADSRRKAVGKFEEALSLSRTLSDRFGEAQALHALGRMFGMAGESEKALELLNQALSIWRELGERQAEASALNNLGITYTLLGDYQRVVDNLTAALSLYRLTGDLQGQARVNNNLCLSYRRLGDYQKALTHCTESLASQRSMGDRRSEAESLNNLGLVHKSLGEYGKAREFFAQSLEIKRTLNDRRAEISGLSNLGQIYLLTGDIPKALDYTNQGLELARTLGERRPESVQLNNIGDIYATAGNHQRSLEYSRQSLTVRREITDRPGEAMVLYSIARSYRELGNLPEAQTNIEAALEIVESLRTSVINQELRDSYFASVQDMYEFYVSLLAQQNKQSPGKGFDVLAWQANERARSRGLIDLLAESRVDIRQGVDPRLLARERSLQRLINTKAESQIRLLSGKSTAERVLAVAKELESLTAEYAQVGAAIRAQSPRYAALTQPPRLSLKDIQEQLSDANTVLLEYALGKERSFVWAITHDSLLTFELPARAKIEAAAEHAIEMLRVSHQRQHVRASELANQELSHILLDPVAQKLGNKRLLIVADEVLQYIPFAALPEPGSERDRPLIANHQIVNLPSALVLVMLRRDLSERKLANKVVAVLADPVLQSADERVQRSGSGSSTQASADDEVVRGLKESGVMSFERLPFSRTEAEAILNFSKTGESLKALDFDASRATATRPELADYRIVHFATHGLINNEHPALSGVVLSLVDKQGRSQDGFLRLHDIYNLRLGSDLVVLSACQTGLGKQIRGEGLVGLVRGFMYAGAPRVIASLWNVKDEATAELMKRFYKKMLLEQQSPAAALRSAQISMWKEPRWRAPYHWAGFTLQGEFR